MDPSVQTKAGLQLKSNFFLNLDVYFCSEPRKVLRTQRGGGPTGTRRRPFRQIKQTLNAFHVIYLSKGFDLSSLFEEKKREEKEELRFATTRQASSVISKLEEVAAKDGKFSVKKSEFRVRLQGHESGRKEKLAIAVDIFAMTLSATPGAVAIVATGANEAAEKKND